jgi:hypothetical protein
MLDIICFICQPCVGKDPTFLEVCSKFFYWHPFELLQSIFIFAWRNHLTKIKKKYAEAPEGGKEEDSTKRKDEKPKRVKPKKHKFIIPEEEKVKEPMTNEKKLYSIKLLLALGSAILGIFVGLIGWRLLIYMVCFWFGAPLLIGYLMAPYDTSPQNQWDWKMFEKTAVGAFFFIFMVTATLLHTLLVGGHPSP